jgi:hypothetical protein
MGSMALKIDFLVYIETHASYAGPQVWIRIVQSRRRQLGLQSNSPLQPGRLVVDEVAKNLSKSSGIRRRPSRVHKQGGANRPHRTFASQQCRW